MLVANRHRQRITAGTFDEFRRLIRIGIVIVGQRFFVDRFVPHVPQLRLNRNTQRMEEIHRLFGQANILFEVKGRGVAHQRIHAVDPGVMDNLHAAAMIPVSNHRYRCLFRHRNHHMRKIFKRGIAHKSGTERDNHRRLSLFRRINHPH